MDIGNAQGIFVAWYDISASEPLLQQRVHSVKMGSIARIRLCFDARLGSCFATVAEHYLCGHPSNRQECTLRREKLAWCRGRDGCECFAVGIFAKWKSTAMIFRCCKYWMERGGSEYG